MCYINAFSCNALSSMMLVTKYPDNIIIRLQKNKMDDEKLETIKNQIDNNQANKILQKTCVKDSCVKKYGKTLIIVPKLIQK